MSYQRKELHCLIVDDNKDLRELIADMIDRLRVFKTIVQAENGIDASIKISNQRFDLVISDMQMPKKDGISFLADEIALRKIQPHQVIVLSGNFDSERVKGVLCLGIKKIIVKPVSYEKLKTLVAEALDPK